MTRAASFTGGTETTLGLHDYDFEGKRLSRSTASGTLQYAYAGSNVVNEYNAGGQMVNAYDYGTDLIRAELGGEGERFYFTDALGSTTSLAQVTGGAASATAKYEYDAWGKQISAVQVSANRVNYTGYRHDEETGLEYARARYYDSSKGQFDSFDPVTENNDRLRKTPAMNFYSYVLSNPLTWTDPEGESGRRGRRTGRSAAAADPDFTISHEVGYVNYSAGQDAPSEDVKTIQRALNLFLDTGYLYPYGQPLLSENGIMDGYTMQLIRRFQQRTGVSEGAGPDVSNDEDVVIRPGGETMKLLNDLRSYSQSAKGHLFSGRINKDRFVEEYRKTFPGQLSETAEAGLRETLSLVEADRHLIDIRWVAYILATAKHEDAGRWVPIQEGKYRAGTEPYYFQEVSIYTEAGIHFLQSPYGKQRSGYYDVQGNELFPVETKEGTELYGDQLGAKRRDPAKKMGRIMATSEGREERTVRLVYYGRGHVQITLWYNYLKMGKLFGLGDKLLMDPDTVLNDLPLSYRLLSEGAVLGKYGSPLKNFIGGERCDYFNARSSINTDKNNFPRTGSVKFGDIVKNYAVAFERILMKSQERLP